MPRIALLVLLVFAANMRPMHALACATVGPMPLPIPVAAEEALILWDEATQTEHFVRAARFSGGEAGMGFLVPTPSRPDLGEVTVDPFRALDAAFVPREVWVERSRVSASCCMLLSRGGQEPPVTVSAQAPDSVRVLETRRVGPYDATVLAADDAQALATWLGAHGFVSRPALATWLGPYVANHWVLTAFLLARANGDGANSLPAVRMSFHAERPFYPYSEPDEPAAPGASGPRTLFVFVVAGNAMEGGRGGAFLPWAGTAELAAPADGARDNERANVAIAAIRAAGLSVPPHPWLSAFRDRSSPRVADLDLFFRASSRAAPLRPAPVERIRFREFPLPLDCIAVPLAVVWLAVVVWRRRRRRARAAQVGEVYRRGPVDP